MWLCLTLLQAVPPPTPLDSLQDSSLWETHVAPTWTCPLPEGKNAVWCASFQMAWDKLKSAMKLVEPEDELLRRLSATPFDPELLPPGAAFAAAGPMNERFLESLRADLKRQFPDNTPRPPVGVDDGWLAYAYLRTGVAFKIPYFERRQALKFHDARGKAHSVKAFGIRVEDDYAYGRLRSQPRILYVGGSEERAKSRFREGYGSVIRDFILDLDGESAPTQLLVAKLPKKESFAATWEEVVGRIAKPGPDAHYDQHPRIGINEVLLVPNVRLATTHLFRQLEGRVIGSAKETILSASQSIRFVLNRGGAELESEAKLLVSPQPRYFVVDGPFLIALRKRGAALPFFVIWVENPELLELWPVK